MTVVHPVLCFFKKSLSLLKIINVEFFIPSYLEVCIKKTNKPVLCATSTLGISKEDRAEECLVPTRSELRIL